MYDFTDLQDGSSWLWNRKCFELRVTSAYTIGGYPVPLVREKKYGLVDPAGKYLLGAMPEQEFLEEVNTCKFEKLF